jgi:Protein of unknown function (DUF3298)
MITKQQYIKFFIALFILIAFVMLGFRTSTKEVYVPPTSVDQIPNPSQEIDKVVINEKTDNYTINASYPKTNSDTINVYFKSYIDEAISQFKADTSWTSEGGSVSTQVLTFDSSYESIKSTDVQNYIFSTSLYTGGAHGIQMRKTFSFTADGRLLNINNLFKNGAKDLETFSKLVQNKLLKRENAQIDWINDGAGSKIENYQSFIVKDDGVVVLFDQYQVAPYSDGQIDITIPIKDFAGIGSPEIFSKSLIR